MMTLTQATTRSICLITPSYLGDIERFSILRRSIELFAPAFPHLAIVHTEDYNEFRDRFHGAAQLQIIRTSAVLPRPIEQRRRKSGPRWLPRNWVRSRSIKGWYAQQLTKLYALADCEYEAAAFIDSDVFLCRPLDPSYFHIGERLKLFRRPAGNAQTLDFDIATHEILGNPLQRITQLYDYMYSPTCFRRSSAISLFKELERQRGAAWIRHFLAQRRPSEYHLLGYAATVLEGCAGYHMIECNPEDLHHSILFPEDRTRLAEEIAQMQIQPKGFVWIQSRLEIEIEKIAAAFERVAEAHQMSSSPANEF